MRREALQAAISIEDLTPGDLGRIRSLEQDPDSAVASWSEIAQRNIRLRRERTRPGPMPGCRDVCPSRPHGHPRLLAAGQGRRVQRYSLSPCSPFFLVWSSRDDPSCCLLVWFVARGLEFVGVRRWAAAGEIEIEKDVEYSNPTDQHLKLTLARPKEIAEPAAAVVFIHGGGWAGGNRDGWQGACEEMARRGFVAVTVSYRFAPAFPFPAAVEDVQAAVRWLRANAERLQDRSRSHRRRGRFGRRPSGPVPGRGDGYPIGSPPAADHRSGADDQSSRVQCVVNIYGPNDLTRELRDKPVDR